ncbi:hypothetical protein FOXG_13482 [Fusarium oxysporum f. sp. lycopersici 4287]|uniref:Uncharacterized protein n=2 Tax=Fusarium oxysporum TaxID=5507 RepID=A0A0J9VVF5_FUSO4|nr:hypothetical protein FOXG_13482 [Fusarium oxysporum f. sp. lycopersici 4287]KNB14691.1 hypothetical protein FOXG_13482 [Fusarium oxysporum f. sp. lycopersici 4287]
MSGRVTKRSSKKSKKSIIPQEAIENLFESGDEVPERRDTTEDRASLHRFAVKNSLPAAMPCTYYFKNKKECRFDDVKKSSRCLECQEKLEAQEEEAGDKVLVLHKELIELQSSLAEAVSRLQWICKIKKRVKERGAELFERGMQELDKEDNILPAL